MVIGRPQLLTTTFVSVATVIRAVVSKRRPSSGGAVRSRGDDFAGVPVRRDRSAVVLALLVQLFAVVRVSAQASTVTPPADELQRAAAAFAAGDWRLANMAYSSLSKRYPTHALSTFRAGVTLTELGRAAEAEPLLRAGERLGVPVPQAAYRLSEALAQQHKDSAAIAELRRAAAVGFFLPAAALNGNRHFAALVTQAPWASVLDGFDAIVHPCQHDPRFREFDFWVGDWDVRPNGAGASTPLSRNRITLEEDGCVVQEHWTGQAGSTGQSFNIFDRSVGTWRQTWVDNSGGQHDYAGALTKGNMVLEGLTPAPNGQLGRIPTRLTLFHVSRDTVRQFSQTSADSGRTWTTAYDLIYVRRKP